jgi:hypothetical protein
MPADGDLRAFQFTRLPKVISPRSHAIIDWSLFAVTLGAAYMFGKKNRIIGLCALTTALVEGANVAFSDFPGGLVRKTTFPTHGRLGLGNLPTFAALPALMGFAKRPESLFFYTQVALAGLVIATTDFNAQVTNTSEP